MIYLIPVIIFGNYGEIHHLKGFSALVFSFNDIDLAYNISDDIYKVIFFPLNIGKIFYLSLFSLASVMS